MISLLKISLIRTSVCDLFLESLITKMKLKQTFLANITKIMKMLKTITINLPFMKLKIKENKSKRRPLITKKNLESRRLSRRKKH